MATFYPPYPLDQWRYWDDVPWWWKVGGGRKLWYENFALVGSFIKDNGLKTTQPNQASLDTAGFAPAVQTEMRAAQPVAYRPGPFHGGIRVPHLHHDGQLYLLTDVQWKDFTKKVINNVHDKLNKAEKISFNQLVDFAEGASSL